MTLFEVVSVVIKTGMLLFAWLTYRNRNKKQ